MKRDEKVDREVDRVMLERAATACRNLATKARAAGVDTDWFEWVPAHLDQMAADIEREEYPT